MEAKNTSKVPTTTVPELTSRCVLVSETGQNNSPDLNKDVTSDPALPPQEPDRAKLITEAQETDTHPLITEAQETDTHPLNTDSTQPHRKDCEFGESAAPQKTFSLKILITGKSGTSKSVVINGIIGKEVIPERDGLIKEARKYRIPSYSSKVIAAAGIEFNVHVHCTSFMQDNILQDSDPFFDELERIYHEVDLIIYCIKMTDTRFLPNNPDAKAMVAMTKKFGPSCWKKTMFALTFANIAAVSNFDPVDSDTQESKNKAFEDGFVMWKDILKSTLIKVANVPEQEAIVTVCPTGHYKKRSLPNREVWLSTLFETATIPLEPEKKLILLAISAERIKEKEDRKAQAKDTPIYNQYIILSPEFIKACANQLHKVSIYFEQYEDRWWYPHRKRTKRLDTV